MIEVTSRHMECTYFNLDHSRMPAVAQQAKRTWIVFCAMPQGDEDA